MPCNKPRSNSRALGRSTVTSKVIATVDAQSTVSWSVHGVCQIEISWWCTWLFWRAASGTGLQRTLRLPIVIRDHCDAKLNLMLFSYGGWHGSTLSSTGVFQAANDHRWGNYRRSALFVQWRAPCWPMCVRATGAMNLNAVCAGQQCTGETCVRAQDRFRTVIHSGRHSRSVVT